MSSFLIKIVELKKKTKCLTDEVESFESKEKQSYSELESEIFDEKLV